jgi:alpha-L-rhamnosidase
MNSYNHYAFGSVVAWVYRYVAGIDTDTDSPGFHHIVIHPHLDAAMPKAGGEYESVYGKITTEWNGTPGTGFSLKVTIPANTSATVYLPVIAGKNVSKDNAAIQAHQENGSYMVDIGSGTYQFDVK